MGYGANPRQFEHPHVASVAAWLIGLQTLLEAPAACLLGGDPTGNPGSGGEPKRLIALGGQYFAESAAKEAFGSWRQGLDVTCCGALPAEEWRPVVVEVSEDRRYLDGDPFYGAKARGGQARGEVAGQADGEACPLVKVLSLIHI